MQILINQQLLHTTIFLIIYFFNILAYTKFSIIYINVYIKKLSSYIRFYIIFILFLIKYILAIYKFLKFLLWNKIISMSLNQTKEIGKFEEI